MWQPNPQSIRVFREGTSESSSLGNFCRAPGDSVKLSQESVEQKIQGGVHYPAIEVGGGCCLMYVKSSEPSERTGGWLAKKEENGNGGCPTLKEEARGRKELGKGRGRDLEDYKPHFLLVRFIEMSCLVPRGEGTR